MVLGIFWIPLRFHVDIVRFLSVLGYLTCLALFFLGSVPNSIKSNADIYDPAWDVELTERGVGKVQIANSDEDAVCDKSV